MLCSLCLYPPRHPPSHRTPLHPIARPGTQVPHGYLTTAEVAAVRRARAEAHEAEAARRELEAEVARRQRELAAQMEELERQRAALSAGDLVAAKAPTAAAPAAGAVPAAAPADAGPPAAAGAGPDSAAHRPAKRQKAERPPPTVAAALVQTNADKNPIQAGQGSRWAQFGRAHFSHFFWRTFLGSGTLPRGPCCMMCVGESLQPAPSPPTPKKQALKELCDKCRFEMPTYADERQPGGLHISRVSLPQARAGPVTHGSGGELQVHSS